MYGYIYLTTNLTNNRKYIGQRKWNDITTIDEDQYLGSGLILKQAIKNLGRDFFIKEIICICETKEELDEKEKFYISKYNAVNDNTFYNIHEGGTGGFTRAGYSEEEFRESMRKTHLKSIGRKLSPEHIEKIRQSSTGRKKSPEEIEKMRERMTGKNNPMYGRKMSEENKRKLIESHNGFFAYNKGKKMSDEQKLKISESCKKTFRENNVGEKIRAKNIGKKRDEIAKKNLSNGAYKRYNSYPLDENIILSQYDKNMNLINTYYGIDEYSLKFNTKTYYNLRRALKENTIFRNSYWKISFSSLSTIENTSEDGNE